MPLNTIVQNIGHGARTAVDTYRNNPRVNAAVNTGLVYGGIKGGALLLENVLNTEPNTLTSIADYASIIGAAAYANHRLNDANVASDAVRPVMKIGLGVLAGYMLGSELLDKDLQNIKAIDFLKAAYTTTAQEIKQYIGISPKALGPIVGGMVPITAWFAQGYNRRNTARNNTTP